MIVTTGAGHGQGHGPAEGGVETVVEDEFLGPTGFAQRKKAERSEVFAFRFFPVDKLLAGELVKEEPVVGHVVIERPNEPVAVSVAVHKAAFASAGFVALGVGVTSHIHPVAGKAFPVVGRVEQGVDHGSPGFFVGAIIFEELILFLILRR